MMPSMRSAAFCANCMTMVDVEQVPAGSDGLMDACGRCDNLMLFDHRDEWEEYEREAVREMVECGNSYKAHSDTEGHDFSGQYEECVYCLVPKKHADDPSEMLPEGVEMGEQ